MSTSTLPNPATPTDATIPVDENDQYRVAISELFSQLDIERVVLVDDAIDIAESKDAIDSLSAAVPTIRGRLAKWGKSQTGPLADLQDELMDDANAARLLQAEWPNLDSRTKLDLLALRLKRSIKAARLATGDAETIEGLRQLVPDAVPIELVKAADWQTKKNTLFDGTFPRTLLFFDRDLGKYGGGKRAGDLLIADMRSRGLDGVHFGLFTNDALTPEREMAIVDELLGSPAVAVSVMAKFRAKAIDKFAEGLRVFLYTTDLQALRTHTADAMTASFASAQTFLNDLSFHSLMASIEAARHEGAYEPDGPLRMVRAALRRSLEADLRANAPTKEFSRIRDASALIIATGSRQSPSLAELEWNERFDGASHLSSCHLPLEVGDIFEVVTADTTEFYMLLVQSCDLMVRSGGKRAHSPATFALAKLVVPESSAPPNAEDGGSNAAKKRLPDRYLKVGKFDWESEENWVVDLTKRIFLPPELLDACVISEDGSSSLRQNMPVPSGMSQGWERRVGKLDSWRKSKIAEARGLVNLLPSDFSGAKRAKIEAKLFGDVLGVGALAGGCIDCDMEIASNKFSVALRRHSRLVEGHAKALLLLSSQHQARPDTLGELFNHGDEPSY